MSVGLKLMSCKGCPRPARDWCAGCRTLSRLNFLWTQQLGPFEDAPALNALRECAGVLSDLAEVRSSFLRPPEGEALGGTPGNTPVPPNLESGPAREGPPESSETPKVEKKVKEKKDRSHKEGRREEKSKERKRRRRTKEKSSKEKEKEHREETKEEAPESLKEDVKEEYEESEEEEPRAGDFPLGRDRSAPSPVEEPLGLTTIGTKLSAPTFEGLGSSDVRRHGEPEPGERGERKTERRLEELPRRRSTASGSARPVSPRRSPRREGGEERKRDRSRDHKRKQGKSKGVKKRERGRDWWRTIRASNQQCRQKRKGE